jgi:hypothetical protein
MSTFISNQITDISYARISTGNTDQLSSLGNQFKALKNLNRGEVIIHIGSGGNELPEKLKKRILDETQNKRSIRLNIIAFDRLTRNFGDLDFILKYVQYIYVLDEDKTFDTQFEVDSIVDRVKRSFQELDAIKSRFLRGRQRGTGFSAQKRCRSESHNNLHDKMFSARKRCMSVAHNLENCGMNSNTATKFKDVVQKSQNLDSLKAWNSLFAILKSLGFSILHLKDEYSEYLDTYKKNKKCAKDGDNNKIYKWSKKFLVELMQKYCNDYDLDTPYEFINQFVNANVRHVNLSDEIEDNEYDNSNDNESDLSDKLDNLIITKSDKKFNNKGRKVKQD